MNKVRIGIIGCANIAIRSALPAMKLADSIDVVAIASRDKEKANKVADLFNIDHVEGYDKLLKRPDLDAVYIPLPPALHKEWCLKAFNYGKHVLVEKPSTTSNSDTKKLIEEAKKNSLVFFENYMFKYHSQIEFILKLISDDEIGDIKLLKSSFGFPMMDPGNFRYSRELGGGVLLDAGGYPVKAATIFLGNDIDVISSNLVYSDELGVDIFGTATLKNNDNKIAQISFGFDNYYQCNLEIWGSKGKIIADRIFTAPPGYNPKIILERQNERHEYLVNSDNHFINLLEDFCYRINNNQNLEELNKISLQSELIDKISKIS